MPKVEFIPIEDILEMRANDEDFKLIEVLSEKNYNKGHIPGAINIPLNNLKEDTLEQANITKDDTIVVYCASYSCQSSTKAAKKLLEMGYENTLGFKAGKRGWKHGGLKLEEG